MTSADYPRRLPAALKAPVLGVHCTSSGCPGPTPGPTPGPPTRALDLRGVATVGPAPVVACEAVGRTRATVSARGSPWALTPTGHQASTVSHAPQSAGPRAGEVGSASGSGFVSTAARPQVGGPGRHTPSRAAHPQVGVLTGPGPLPTSPQAAWYFRLNIWYIFTIDNNRVEYSSNIVD